MIFRLFSHGECGAVQLTADNFDTIIGKLPSPYTFAMEFFVLTLYFVLFVFFALFFFCPTANTELVLINFYADWCRFSNMLAPIFDEAADKVTSEFPSSRVILGKVDCDKEST